MRRKCEFRRSLLLCCILVGCNHGGPAEVAEGARESIVLAVAATPDVASSTDDSLPLPAETPLELMHAALGYLNEAQSNRALAAMAEPGAAEIWRQAESQSGRPLDRVGVIFDERGNVRMLDGGPLGLPVELHGNGPEEMGREFLLDWSSLVQGAGIEIQLHSVSGHPVSAVRFTQHHLGLPVFGSGILLRLDAAEGLVHSILGTVVPTHLLPDQELVVSETEARALVLASGLLLDLLDTDLGVYDPVIMKSEPGMPVLAWRVIGRDEAELSHSCYVDAMTGDVLEKKAEFMASEQKNVFYYFAYQCGPLDCNCSQLALGTTENVCEMASDIWIYYNSAYGRDGWDDNHSSPDHDLPFHADVPGIDYNAFWDGFFRRMLISPSAVCSDVIGHEFTHGVIQDEAGLPSNAINEGLSDIMGEFFSQSLGTSDWVVKTGSPNCSMAVRSLYAPAPYPDHYSNYSDTAADPAHFNATIIGKLGYLLGRPVPHVHWGRSVTGVGRESAQSLFYDAIVGGLSSSSGYIALRAALNDAAVATGNGTIIAATKAATEAVGLWSMDYDLGVDSDKAVRSAAFTVNGALGRFVLWKTGTGLLSLIYKLCEMDETCGWYAAPTVGLTSHAAGVAILGTAMHFIWKENTSNAMHWRYMNSNGALSAETALAFSTDTDLDAAEANGRVYVFWKTPGAGEQPLAGAYYGRSYWTALPPLPVDAVSAHGPAVAGDTAGNVWIAYVRNIGGAGRTVVRKYMGGTWGAEMVFSEGLPVNQQPALVFYRNRIHVAASATLPLNAFTGYASCSMPCGSLADFTRWVKQEASAANYSVSLAQGGQSTSPLYLLHRNIGVSDVWWRNKNSE